MTKKQILLSTLIFTIFNNIMLAMDGPESENKITRYKGPISEKTLNRIYLQLKTEGVDIKNITGFEQDKKPNYEYPQLPSQLNDFRNFDKKQYEKEYQDAIDRELNDKIPQQDIKDQCELLFHLTDALERNLIYNLIYLKHQQNSLSQKK